MNKDLVKSIVYRIHAIFGFFILNSFRKNCRIIISKNSLYAPTAEINVSKRGGLDIGRDFALLKHAALICREEGRICIGNNVSIGIRNYINCHDYIQIGNNVNFAQDIKIYDHDHDFKNYSLQSSEWRNHYTTSPIKIGSNVWIGAGVIILQGTEIGDNCVVGAGSVLKGKYPSNSLIVQLKSEKTIPIEREGN